MLTIKNRIKKLLALSLIVMTLFSCEDPIDVDLAQSQEQLVVEAIVTDSKDTQSIFLSLSAPYFSNLNILPPVKDAQIGMLDENGKVFLFTHHKDGRYIYVPTGSDTFTNGLLYNIGIAYKNDTFISSSRLNYPAIYDSLTYAYNSEDDVAAWDEGYYATFYAKDRVGEGDNYWIRTFRNDEYTGNLNLSVDGNSGTTTIEDGKEFGFNVRFFGLNEFDSAYQKDEKVRVEILTISPEFNYFLQLMIAQLNNSGMFQSPPTNVPSNIINRNSDGIKAIGFFQMAAIETKTIKFK